MMRGLITNAGRLWRGPLGVAVCIFAFAAILACAFYGGRGLFFAGAAHAQVAVVPFTLRMEAYDYQKTPNGELFAKQMMARRSDGAFVSASNWFGVAGVYSADEARTLRLADGRRFSLYDGVSGFTQLSTLSDKQLAIWKESFTEPPANCLDAREILAGHDVILGHPVVVIQMPAILSEQDTDWRAPDLGCQSLGHRTDARQSDGSLKLMGEEKAVVLSLGEPDPSLFDVPSSYISMKPSQATRVEAQRLGIPWTDALDKAAQRFDYMESGRPVPKALW